MLMLLMLACSPATLTPNVPDPGEGDGTASDGGGDGTGDDGGGDDGGEVEEVGPAPTGDEVRHRDCDGLYDPDALLQFELEFSDASWAALNNDFAAGVKNYHPATFTWEDESVPANVRLKGNPSFSWMGDKLQFVVSFNEDDPEARFHGVRKVALDSSWYEPTMLRDRLAWSILREVEGLPATCANSARLDVNGAYYGLFTNIEYYDHEWLEGTFGDEYATGTLWKYGSDPKTNEDAADPTLLNQFSYTTQVEDYALVGEPAEWLLAWAAEAALGDDDGYWCCSHNFYIYEHPTRGLLFVPWDLDDLFDVTPYDTDPITGYDNPWGLFRQYPFLALVKDDTWGPVYVDAIEQLASAMDPEILLPRVEEWSAQIAASVEEDPHRSISLTEHEEAIPRLEDYLAARKPFLDSWVACARGETTDADGDGSAVCEDPDDGDPSIHPGATESCNGRDDDADGDIDELSTCEDCATHAFGEGEFLFCNNDRSWTEAEANCEARGGTLGFPKSTPEYYLFYWYTWPVFDGWWLGATDAATEGTWLDPAGASVSSYAWWGSGQPNGSTAANCAGWDSTLTGWNDYACSEAHPSVCRL